MFLDKYIGENGVSTDYPVFSNQIYRDLFIQSKDLFLSQFKNNKFNAADVIIKYLAVENYYGLNDFGFELYNKLQFYRINQNWEKRFVNLIESFEKGYNSDSIIDTDLNYSIHDGAHRLALAIFHDIKELRIRLYNTNLYRREYGFDWIEPYFTSYELNMIINKYQELLNRCANPYYCILWPPSHKLFEEFRKKIPTLENDVFIVDSELIYLNSVNLKKFIYDVYRTDDIRLEKLNLKYEYMMNSIKKDTSFGELYPVYVMKIKMNNLDFRVKPLTGLPQSKTTMRIKTSIRDEYQRFIIDYYYDIIMHMTDNNKQNEDVSKIINKVKERI